MSTEAPPADSAPVFTGTPAHWWAQATPITEAEAAERLVGSWYIVAETRSGVLTDSYRLSTPSHSSNEQRKRALYSWRGAHPQDVSPTVRRLILVPQQEPAWVSAELVMADRAVGSDERALWRKAAKWHLLSDGRISVHDRAMAELRPAVVSVTEQPPNTD